MLVPVMSKAHKRFGVFYPEKPTRYALNFNDDKSVTIMQDRKPMASFKVGDEAEYDSYNLSYLGTITKITEKAVTIVAYKGNPGMESVHRLNLEQFCWRNADFDKAKILASNNETMNYI